jgi:hypothetical protein
VGSTTQPALLTIGRKPLTFQSNQIPFHLIWSDPA